MNTFSQELNFPRCESDIQQCLLSPLIKTIHLFVLGPVGTNISQASERWAKRMGVQDKVKIKLCSTPEDALEMARLVFSPGELGLFWTCAVYFRLNELFFRNPDTLPFFVQEIMALDGMQLATHKDLLYETKLGIPQLWKIASHPSPAPLVSDLGCQIVLVNSNAAAAGLCATGDVQACITTESAKVLHNLATIHEFGCPDMVFFGGITSSGIRLIREVFLSLS